MADSIAQRVNDEPGPGKQDYLISVASYHPEKHILLHISKNLLKWRKAFAQQRQKISGNNVFLQMQKDAHVHQGQYYLEYLKFACDPVCNGCKNDDWTGGIPIKRSPLLALDGTSTKKYLPVDASVTTFPTEIDSVLPSVQVKKMVLEGELSSSDKIAVQRACSKLNIAESTCRIY